MTETVPKPMPIANCPVCKLRGLDSTCTESFGFVSCNWCVYQCGTASEDDGEEAIRLHNLIARPQQSAEPVANTERLDLGNLRVIVECMTCTGKLPHGCPNCKGLDFCVKRHAQKTLDKLEAIRLP